MTNVVLATSNGTGMGHLIRQAAVALALEEPHQGVLFSLSLGLPVVAGTLGLRGEYCPSYERDHIDRHSWESYLRDRLVALVRETESTVVVFDGVAPYLGLGRARMSLPDTRFVWLRRGMWRPGTGAMLRRSAFFDTVIEPGDLAGDADRGPTAGLEAVRVPPVSLLEVIEPLTREEARRQLGIPDDGTVALLTLGTGRLGDVEGPGQVAVDRILAAGDIHLAVTRWTMADRAVPFDSGITELKGAFPLARYLSAFDFAVSSAGYNAVHELVPAGLPTLFVANTSTRTDDQVARASRLAELGLALHARDDDPDGVGEGVEALLDPHTRRALAASAASTRDLMGGASEIAAHIAGSGDTALRPATSRALASAERRSRLREAVKRILGDRGTNLVRRILGRAPTPVTGRPTVRLVPEPTPYDGEGPMPLAFTDTVTPDDLRLGTPIEHILPGSSDQYRRHRRELVAKYYRIH